MIEWAKSKFGEAWTDEIDEEARKELAKWGVPKSEFNAKSRKVAEYEAKIQELQAAVDSSKAAASSEDDFRSQIQQLKDEYARNVERMWIEKQAWKDAAKAGAKNPDTILLLSAPYLENAKRTEDNTIEGYADYLKQLSEAEDTSSLFNKSTSAVPDIAGAEPGHPGNVSKAASKLPKDMTYDELCEYLEENPDATL